MFVLVKEKERRRGRVISCRRGNQCRCDPRCNNRPVGYEDEMVAYFECVWITKSVCHTEADMTGKWVYGFTDDRVSLSQTYLSRKCMIVAGLCRNASSPLFAMGFHSRMGVEYSHLSILLKHCDNNGDKPSDIFKHISPFYYNEAQFIRERSQFLLCIISTFSVSANIVDVALCIKMLIIQLNWSDINDLFQYKENSSTWPQYYWYHKTEEKPWKRICY